MENSEKIKGNAKGKIIVEKKKKIFYLDFIRVLSMLMIVTYHFYAHFSENNISGFKTIFANGKWGLIGVALFFMISGASLMYNYKDKLEIKQYIKKRFLGIYPMFWIAYTLVFIYLFYQTKTNIWGLPIYNMIPTIFAMDGYLSSYIKTFYIIGEWFLGCIVLIYAVFPLLRKCVNKYPKITLVIATLSNLLVLFLLKNAKMPINQNFIVSLYSFLLGMYAIQIKEFKLWQAIAALIVSIIGYIAVVPNMNMQVLAANISGYSLYVVLAYIGTKITNNMLQKIFVTISKYSYPIFLMHHYTIMKIENTFQNKIMGLTGTILLYITCWIVIIGLAKLVYMINKEILDFFKKEKPIYQIEGPEKIRKD